jgi:hypothetical protein
MPARGYGDAKALQAMCMHDEALPRKCALQCLADVGSGYARTGYHTSRIIAVLRQWVLRARRKI